MTRINLSVPPAKLINSHLLAEHREIVRIPNCVKKGRYSMKGQPDQFTLGTGHVKFFYDKIGYLKSRYESIYAECKKRGFNITYFGDAFDGVNRSMMKDYTPNDRDREIIKGRLVEKDVAYIDILKNFVK